MIKRLVIQNYQSIEEADLRLGPLTVVVGENRAGKSATLRAMRALFFNETGADFIRRGQPSCAVTVELSDGPTVSWVKKRAGGAEYALTHNSGDAAPRTFTKLGSSVPEEIVDALNIRAIKVSDTVTLTPQIHKQEDYAFLLDLPAGQAAKALAKFTRLDVVVEAQSAIRLDLRRGKTGVAHLEKTVEELELQLVSYQDLDAEGAWVSALEKQLVDAGELGTELNAATNALGRYLTAKEDSEIVVPPVEWIDGADEDLRYFIDVERIHRDYRTAVDTSARVKKELMQHDLNAEADIKQLSAIKTCPACGQEIR